MLINEVRTIDYSLIKKIELLNFRNYYSCNAELHQFNVLFGNNGTGKTNFLEAISLLSPGKGLRNVKFEDLLNPKHNNLKINCFIENKFGKNNLSIINESKNNFLNKKTFYLESEPLKKLQQLLCYVRPIWLVPKMDTIFLEETKTQRNFFDRLIFNSDSKHLTRINTYNKALKERNTLLKKNIKNDSWFNALEEIITTQGLAIATIRLEFLEKINNIITTKPSEYFSNIDLYIDGFIENIVLKYKKTLSCEDIVKEKLKETRNLDYKIGSTSIGIHKSNFNIINKSTNLLAKQCSTGEQKLILITIIIAFIKLLISENKYNIILLLDEVLVHLDNRIKNQVISEILNLPLQAIFTTTDKTDFHNFKNQLNFLEVYNNTITNKSYESN